jgi:hypothetical protein
MGRELAVRYNVESMILPLLQFNEEGNGDIALTKSRFFSAANAGNINSEAYPASNTSKPSRKSANASSSQAWVL